MPAEDDNQKPAKRSSAEPETVESFLASLDHPLKQAVIALRQMILDADPSIAEGIKWNVPSFHTSQYFATFHLRAPDSVQVILHLDAKPRDTATTGISIADPEVLLHWLAKDRASVSFRDLKEVEAKQSTFSEIIRQWIRYV